MNIENPPAFPMPIAGCNDGSVYHASEVVRDGQGMSLRDFFAATIPLTALDMLQIESQTKTRINFHDLESEWRYAKADAMLIARQKTTIPDDKMLDKNDLKS